MFTVYIAIFVYIRLFIIFGHLNNERLKDFKNGLLGVTTLIELRGHYQEVIALWFIEQMFTLLETRVKA